MTLMLSLFLVVVMVCWLLVLCVFSIADVVVVVVDVVVALVVVMVVVKVVVGDSGGVIVIVAVIIVVAVVVDDDVLDIVAVHGALVVPIRCCTFCILFSCLNLFC